MQDTHTQLSKVIHPESDDPLKLFADLVGYPTAELAMRFLCHRLRSEAREIQPPLGLRKMLSILGGRIRLRDDLVGVDGVLEVDHRGYLVGISSHQSWRRQRFTIAHEIGHILLMQSLAQNPKALSSMSHPDHWAHVEALCNFAARELLVPLADLEAQMEPDPLEALDSAMLAQLYDRYLVSYYALGRRLIDVGLDAVVFWKRQARRNGRERTWRVVRAYSEGFFIPKQVSARNHLSPNILESSAPLWPDGLLEAGKQVVVFSINSRRVTGHAVVVHVDRKVKVDDRPTFEGFKVPDEPLGSFEAVMLFRAFLPSPVHDRCSTP